MKRIYLLVFLLQFFCWVSCDNTHNKLHSVASIIDSDPEMAIQLLESIDSSHLISKRNKAYYSLLMAMAIDKRYVDTSDVSIILPAIDYFSVHGRLEDKAKAWYYLGRIQYNCADYFSAAYSFAKAEDILIKTEDNKYKMLVSTALADNFSKCYFSEEELKYCINAVEYAKALGDSTSIIGCELRFAIALANNHKYEDSFSIFERLLLAEHPHPSFKTDCRKLFAFFRTVSFSDNWEKTKNLFEEAVSLNCPFTMEEYCAYAYTIYRCGEINSSMSILSNVPSDYSDPWKCLIAEKENDYREAYRLLNRSIDYQNRIVSDVLSQSLYKAQQDYYHEKANEAEIARKRNRLTFFLIICSLILLILLSSLLVLNYLNKLRIKQLKANNSISEMSLLINTLKENANDIEKRFQKLQKKYIRANKNKFSAIAELCFKYERVRNKGEKDIDKLRSQFFRIMDSLYGEDGKCGGIEKIVNNEYGNLMIDFRKDFPDLKEDEYTLLCLYSAGFSATFISDILKIERVDTIYTRKNADSALNVPSGAFSNVPS